MKPIIKVTGIAKQYQIGAREAAYDTFRDAIMETLLAPIRRLRGRANGSNRDTIWALNDVSFEVEPGEVVGIVGRNGAGKSTLLKVLSRITEPTRGRIELYGRVASLLEVGTGFHQELTGRENIYLNGAILGMKKVEIDRNFDQIVEFAEIDKFIDTPVKRYSTGMYMRLAFSVAAHLEPEILLVDEVLAVGDAAFQKKCLGRMSEVAKQGRTVLFVSHNMTAVNQLCPRALMLTDGRVYREGRTAEVVAEYLKHGSEGGGELVWIDRQRAPGGSKFRLHAVRTISRESVASEVDIDQEVSVEVDFWSFVPDARNVFVNVYLLDGFGTTVLSTANTPNAGLPQDAWFGQAHQPGLYRARCTFPANFLNEGLYYVNVYVATLGPLMVEVDAPQVISFRVFDTGVMREAGGGRHWPGTVRVRLPWWTDLLQPINGNSIDAAKTEEITN